MTSAKLRKNPAEPNPHKCECTKYPFGCTKWNDRSEVPHSNTFHTSIKVFRNFFFPESCFFQKHYLSLQCPSKIEAQKAKVSGRGTYILKAFSERFGFDALRTSQLPIVCQKQSNGNAPWGVVYILTLLYSVLLCIHQRGAFSVARFDRQGNAKTFKAWTGHRTGSTFFMFIVEY